MTYRSARKPWAHQKEALAAMAGKEAFALLLAMRLGKTKILVDDFGRLEDAGEVTNLMVIAPGGVYKTWEAAVLQDVSEDLLDRLSIYVWESGGRKSQTAVRQRRDFDRHHGARVLIMNIEALSSVKDAQVMATKFLASGPSMLAIDESTTVKNPGAERTKFIVDQLGPLASYRRILSGLPTPRSPLDIFSQFEFLDWRIIGQKNYYAFRARYAITVRRHFPGRKAFDQVVGYRNEEEIKEKIGPWSFRRTLEDVYDVPAKLYSYREVELTDEQRRLYDELLQFATTKLDEESHITATLVITQLLRLHQVLCGHGHDELGRVVRVPENRTRELLALLDEYDGKAIVWVTYDADVEHVSSALRREYGDGTEEDGRPDAVARFWGGNREERENEERRFLTDPDCRFMVSTPAAGGRGRTWTVANLLVYYSNSYDLEHRSQSEERGQAVGKKDAVAIVDLIARGTTEQKIIDALKAKKSLAAVITGDDFREWLG